VLTIALTSGEFALFTIHAGTDQKPNLRRGLRVRRF
jgi:hypothetical protein